MPASNIDAAAVVYGALQDVQAMSAPQAAAAELPAFALYKLAREEELTAYRSLCRVLAMHYGGAALQNPCSVSDAAARSALRRQQRLLEDVQEALGISEERGALELQAAAEDEVVRGVHRSGVLRRRADFFDGVDDVALPASGAEERAEDDGRALRAPAAKAARMEGTTPAASTAARGSVASNVAATKARAAAKKKVLATISELGQEVERAANALLHASDAAKEREAESRLQRAREALLKLRADPALEA